MYCDFCSAAETPETVAQYCFALEKQIFHLGEDFASESVDTVFLGGGTPTLVLPGLMADVLDALRRAFRIQPDAEFTAEGNPGTLTEEWLEMAMKRGLNRLSLGVQAAQNPLLKTIGRIHTAQDAQEAVHLARRCGVKNLNLDAMFGLPGQTAKEYLDTLRTFRDWGAEHISAYSLILEEGTPLHDLVQSGRLSLPDEEETAEMYEQGIAWLEQNGYQRYEVSNFAKPGKECRHNLGYWQDAWYLGLGVAAHSMLPPSEAQRKNGAVRVRRGTTSNIKEYIRALHADEPAPAESVELIDRDEAMFETMMLGLRTVRGVSETRFARLHGTTLIQRYGAELDGLVKEELGAWHADGDDRCFALTPRGMEMQNDVLVRLMK